MRIYDVGVVSLESVAIVVIGNLSEGELMDTGACCVSLSTYISAPALMGLPVIPGRFVLRSLLYLCQHTNTKNVIMCCGISPVVVFASARQPGRFMIRVCFPVVVVIPHFYVERYESMSVRSIQQNTLTHDRWYV